MRLESRYYVGTIGGYTDLNEQPPDLPSSV